MLAWTKQINTEGNVDSRIIIRWSQSHATSNINNYISLNDMNHNRNTALERLVINYQGAYTSLTCTTSPSVTDVVQTFS